MLAILFALYCLAVLYSNYQNGSFSFHDLGLIDSFLANTAYDRGWFYVSATDLPHWTVHFTPTLILLVPFYRIFESQFLLPIAGWLALTLTAMIWVRIYRKILPDLFVAHKKLGVLFFTLIFSNYYCLTNLLSAHFEIFYLLLGSAWAGCIVYRKSGWLLLALEVLTLGVRQDIGFYLAFFALSLYLSLRPLSDRQTQSFLRNSLLLAGTGALIYSWVASFIIMPALGVPAQTHLSKSWSHLGNSWLQVFLSLLQSPLFLLKSIFESGLWLLLGSFMFVPLFAGPSLWVSLIPAIILLVSGDPQKNQLNFYNSSLVLPPILWAFGLGLRKISKKYPRYASPLIFAILGLGLLNLPIIKTRLISDIPFAVSYPASHIDFSSDLKKVLSKQKKPSKVSVDFKNCVYLPNSVEILLLNQWPRADVIVIVENGSTFLSGTTDLGELSSAIEKSGRFHVAVSAPHHTIYSANKSD